MKPEYQFPIDFSQIDGQTLRDLEELCRIDLMAQAIAAEALLPSVGKENEATRRSVDGFGECVLSGVPTELALASKLNGETFEDPGFRKFLGKRYPAVKAKSGGTKLLVGWVPSGTGHSWAAPVKRFTKTYPVSPNV